VRKYVPVVGAILIILGILLMAILEQGVQRTSEGAIPFSARACTWTVSLDFRDRF